jgi:hypothetical protein
MKNYQLWLSPESFRVVAFYPYTSGVCNRILEQNHNYETPEHAFLNTFGNEIQRMAESLGCRWYNKVVVELQYTPKDLRTDIGFKSVNLFVSWYDGRWSIGLAMWQDPWLEKQNQNKYFTYPIEVKAK